jgi:hypothetical protein
LGSHHLLLVAARQLAHRLVDGCQADLQVGGQAPRRVGFGAGLHQPGVRHRGKVGQRHVGADGHVEDQALVLAVLGQKADAFGDGSAG